jgi:hypothetical protein
MCNCSESCARSCGGSQAAAETNVMLPRLIGQAFPTLDPSTSALRPCNVFPDIHIEQSEAYCCYAVLNTMSLFQD